MKKKNEIRNDFVKDSLLEYNNLATTLKENTESAVRDLLKETVLNTYAEILSEEDDKDEDYEVETVKDTESGTSNDDVDDMTDDEEDVDAVDGMGSEDNEDDALSDDDSEEWSEFDKYKVSDDEYDFSEAEDEDIVKVYKLLKDDDNVVVVKDAGKVNIKDNETGAEYIIDMGGDDNTYDDSLPTDDIEYEVDTEDFDNEEEDDNMNESKIFEIALNEYDSNVGYTDNYQNRDVMTTDGVDNEPGKNVNDWDKGVPHTNSKPWSGKKGSKSENQPFHGQMGKTVEEEEISDGEEASIEEATNVGGFVQQNSTSKSHVPNSNGRNARSASKGGRRIKGTVTPRYSTGGIEEEPSATNEAIARKADRIFAENLQLKNALRKFRNTLEEASVTNVNLGNIIKLITENSTSNDEKKMIIERFGREATTLESSRNLYENISRELKKNQKMNIDESKQYSVNNQINEKQLYMSDDIVSSLDLMHRICK